MARPTHDAQIKAAARQQMAEHGTAGLSLRGIARQLGITAPAIYNYFPRLEDLITALIVDAFSDLADVMEAADAAVASERALRPHHGPLPDLSGVGAGASHRLPAHLRQPDPRLPGAGGGDPPAGAAAVPGHLPLVPACLPDR